MMVDHTGRYSYVFYACSVCVVSAGLFLMGSFCFLDGKQGGDEERRKKETSLKMSSDSSQKSNRIMAAMKRKAGEDAVNVTSVILDCSEF